VLCCATRFKFILFFAGVNRHLCYYLHFADYLALRGVQVRAECITWLLPELRKTQTPGIKVGEYIKDLCEPDADGHGGGPSRFSTIRVPGLPSKPHAKGIREGCAQELVSGGSEADGTPQGPCMPMQLASYGFGHAVTTDGGNGSTAFFAYVPADRALAGPACSFVAGWPAPPYGHTGPLPTTPRLSPLEHMGVNMVQLTVIILAMFRLDDAANEAPAAFLPRGKQWEGVEAAFASLLMYYKERKQAGEMVQVNQNLECHVCSYMRSSPGQGCPVSYRGSAQAEQMIETWGDYIRNDFNRRNLHMATRDTCDAQLTASQQELGRAVGELSGSNLAVKRELVEHRTQLEKVQGELATHKTEVMNALSAMSTEITSKMDAVVQVLQQMGGKMPTVNVPATPNTALRKRPETPSGHSSPAPKRSKNCAPVDSDDRGSGSAGNHVIPPPTVAPAPRATAQRVIPPLDVQQVLMQAGSVPVLSSLADWVLVDLWARLVNKAPETWDGGNRLVLQPLLQTMGLQPGGNKTERDKTKKLVSKVKNVFELANALATNEQRNLFRIKASAGSGGASTDKQQAKKNIDRVVRAFLLNQWQIAADTAASAEAMVLQGSSSSGGLAQQGGGEAAGGKAQGRLKKDVPKTLVNKPDASQYLLATSVDSWWSAVKGAIPQLASVVSDFNGKDNHECVKLREV